jgi:hypothetical protein
MWAANGHRQRECDTQEGFAANARCCCHRLIGQVNGYARNVAGPQLSTAFICSSFL